MNNEDMENLQSRVDKFSLRKVCMSRIGISIAREGPTSDSVACRVP